MKGLFIPEITAEMFRNGSLESIETLMAEGEIYDIDYQEPCEDCISRAEAIKEFQIFREYSSNRSNSDWVDRIEAVLKDLPSVTPWPGWTSATQLPEPNTAVLLYVKYKSSGQWTYQLGMWNANKQSWEDWRTPYQLEEEFEVIAWMELPEIYEEDNHE